MIRLETAVTSVAATIAVAALLQGCKPVADRATGGPTLQPIAENGSYGCRRPFGLGVYDGEVDKTVVCWNGEGMSVYVRSYDHAADAWGESRMICANRFTAKWDYHNYPVMVLAPDGHYLVFFFRHGHEAVMLRSPEPHTIDGEWTRTSPPADRNAYPMPIVCEQTIYLFYSRSDDTGAAYRSYRYIKSTDSGLTWSESRKAIDSQQKVPGRFDEVYAHGYYVEPATAGRPARILIGWEMHGGLAHNAGGRNNYVACFMPESETFRSVGGADLGPWIDFAEMEGQCLVDVGEAPRSQPFGYTTLPTVLPDGTPLVLYRHFEKTLLARWDGARWLKIETPLPGASDILTGDDDKLRVLAVQDGQFQCYESADGGSIWVTKWSADVPHANGSDALAGMGFVENGRPKAEAVVTCINRATHMSDYSGRWPVLVMQSLPGK